MAAEAPETEQRLSADLVDWFNARWLPRLGAIDGLDLGFIASLLNETRPQQLLEIGCASGFSTALMAMVMEEIGGCRIDSFDLLDHFYADPARPLGYLINEALPHPSVSVTLHPRRTSFDVAERVSAPIDVCFIDAKHKHPWPVLDTLAVLPHMRAGGVIIHHDLQMFRDAEAYATGPKILFDQIPPAQRIPSWSRPPLAGADGLLTRKVRHNVFALRVPDQFIDLGNAISDGFCIGWDAMPGQALSGDLARRASRYFETHYPPGVLRSFRVGLNRYRGSAG